MYTCPSMLYVYVCVCKKEIVDAHARNKYQIVDAGKVKTKLKGKNAQIAANFKIWSIRSMYTSNMR